MSRASWLTGRGGVRGPADSQRAVSTPRGLYPTTAAGSRRRDFLDNLVRVYDIPSYQVADGDGDGGRARKHRTELPE